MGSYCITCNGQSPTRPPTSHCWIAGSVTEPCLAMSLTHPGRSPAGKMTQKWQKWFLLFNLNLWKKCCHIKAIPCETIRWPIGVGFCLRFLFWFFPTCQVRVVRFYVSCLLLLPLLLLLLLLVLLLLLLLLLVLLVLLVVSSSSSNCDPRSTVFAAGPQPRSSTPSVPCRTSTTTIPAQCSLPDLNREYPRPVFPAGPQPRPSTPSVPCRTSTASIHAKRYAT